MISQRPFADGRHTAVFVFNRLHPEAGDLTRLWLARLCAFAEAGWATHAALINKDAQLDATVAEFVASGRMPADTVVHHYALRDRRIRPSWWTPLPPGASIDPRVGDWLDWLTGQIPGAVVVADSPAAYPYLAAMSNPLVARVANIAVAHLAGGSLTLDPVSAPLGGRFAERLAGHERAFDALVTMTTAQAQDLRARFGADLSVSVLPPAVPGAESGLLPLPTPSASPLATTPADPDSGSRPEPVGDRAARIVSVGPLDAASHHDEVLHACRPALLADPGLRLEVVGRGELTQPLLDLVEELGLTGRVQLVEPRADPIADFTGAALTVWAGRRAAYPLAIARSLVAGVPVVARDVRYGPAELLSSPELGELVRGRTPEDLAAAIGRRLARPPTDPGQVRTAADRVLGPLAPRSVWSRWLALAEVLADRACDRHHPSLLIESVSTTTRVLRLPGVLADSETPLEGWSCELPGLVQPAGWLTRPSAPPGAPKPEDEGLPVHAHAAGPTREVVVELRSNALAFVAADQGAYRLDFTNGTETVPLLTTDFEPRVVASRVGNATLERHRDGSVWVSPRQELLFASNLDGGLLVRIAADGSASDVTHALNWIVDIDWADLVATEEGAQFTGVLRATGIAPAPDSTPAICVTDVGGFSRTVGLLHYTAPPTLEGLAWSAPVAGVIRSDPLVATTALAGQALSLHMGFRGLLVPIGGLWTHGRRGPLPLSCPRGMVTLLPSPGGRVLAAPGRGYRARVSGLVRSALGGLRRG
ncbi:MAG: glycosyltransferase [Candidatus Nanopelagicales bacterium]